MSYNIFSTGEFASVHNYLSDSDSFVPRESILEFSELFAIADFLHGSLCDVSHCECCSPSGKTECTWEWEEELDSENFWSSENHQFWLSVARTLVDSGAHFSDVVEAQNQVFELLAK